MKDIFSGIWSYLWLIQCGLVLALPQCFSQSKLVFPSWILSRKYLTRCHGRCTLWISAIDVTEEVQVVVLMFSPQSSKINQVLLFILMGVICFDCGSKGCRGLREKDAVTLGQEVGSRVNFWRNATRHLASWAEQPCYDICGDVNLPSQKAYTPTLRHKPAVIAATPN